MKLDYMLDLRKTLNALPKRKLALARLTGKKISVGLETREGWTGYLEFFVFWCRDCRAFSKDYAHSWPERRYVTCQRCGTNFYFPKLSAVLKEFTETLRFLIRLRFTARRG